ncbi:UbiA family prenyltransferase [Candidatus Woesearchaeota archaeon]|nr:UbiA family prenyltransferase [Candidatus Woesearchaeota archaeon]
MGFKDLIQLLKAKEYYKNLLVYLPLLFVEEFFNLSAFLNVTKGFIALCLISSSYYIINDVLDKNKDSHHPEKKTRPIASGKISVFSALIISLLLLITSLLMAYSLDIIFTIILVSLHIFTLLYSSIFKKIFLLDIFFISFNFLLRPLSGVFIIFKNEYVRISPWLILVSFFLAFYLSSSKKRANKLFLKDTKYNPSLKNYTKKSTFIISQISTTLIILTYSLFTFFSDHPNLFVTIPLVMYTIIYYNSKVESGSKIGRDLTQAFKDKVLITSSILWVFLTFTVIYFF